jgi:hypothetical protein
MIGGDYWYDGESAQRIPQAIFFVTPWVNGLEQNGGVNKRNINSIRAANGAT